MKTFTALISAKVGSSTRLIKTQIRADTASEAKWLLQAIYGFHAVSSLPSEIHEVALAELQSPRTPEQQRIETLKTAKDRASDALKAERDRQKRTRAMNVLRSTSMH
jgi:hypothetical protein